MINNVAKFFEELAALPADQRQEKIDALEPEDVKLLSDHKITLVGENETILDQVKARRLELQRLNDKPNPESPPAPPAPGPEPEPPAPPADTSGVDRLRDENNDAAREVVLSKLGITDPVKVEAVNAKVAQLEDGSITQPKREKLWISAAAAAFPEEFAAAQATLKQMQDNAEDFTQSNAGAGSGSGEGGDGSAPISPGAKDLISQGKKQGVDFTPEQAEKIETEGMRRVYK